MVLGDHGAMDIEHHGVALSGGGTERVGDALEGVALDRRTGQRTRRNGHEDLAPHRLGFLEQAGHRVARMTEGLVGGLTE